MEAAHRRKLNRDAVTTSAFDGHASSYDAVANSALGAELRRRVRLALLEVIDDATTVIDLGCGSGLDADWLAPQVQSVLAIEPAREMAALASERCARHGNVQVRNTTVSDLAVDPIAAEGPADVVLANFGVVNCVGDLGVFSDQLAALMKPHGYAVLVTMPRWCPIELLIGAATFNRALLARRRQSSAPEYPDLVLNYASATSLADALGPSFDLVHAESLGLFLPPFEQRDWVESRPRLLRALAAADNGLASTGAQLGIGDHHIAVFRATS